MVHQAATYVDTHIEEEQKRYHTFINVALWLSVLTGNELVIIFMPFAAWFIIAGLVVLSLIKFVAVIFWFMHLIYDKKLCFWLFIFGLLLATGTVTALLFLMSPHDVDRDALTEAANSVHQLA